ncbi:PAS domain-containing protein [Patulibacter sp.]|uniref:PAS domain-containing protein n=1 Tax=Patulibacter sp. TaxID=1912859 RepID=UPI002724925E|nr:PAS domain-containing protein [Patulibacter sp.]MDO9409456.1 PAS domain-containing protein [Patulibacter sp.]
MAEWKSTPRRERPATAAPALPPDRLPAFGSGSLTRGTARVVVRPVSTAEGAEDVALVLWRIRGVGGVEVTRLGGGSAEYAVTLVRPTALGSDLRGAFGRDLVACRKDGDRFVVEVHPPAVPATVVPDPSLRSPLAGPRPSAPLLPAPTPVAGEPPTVGRFAGWSARAHADAPPAGPPARRPLAGSRPAATGAGPAVAADHHGLPAMPSRDPVAMLEALAADPELSILAAGPDRVVRVAYGGLHHHFGRSGGDLAGRTLTEVLPLRGQQALADRAAAAVRGARSSLLVDGLPGGRVCEFTLHPAPFGTAAPGCVVVARDVTRAREQEGVVVELSRVFDVLFGASFVGVGLVSARGEWLRVNPALEGLLGHREMQLVGSKVDDVTQVDDVAREAHRRDVAIRSGETSYELDKRMLAANGDVVVLHVRMSGIVDDGEIRGWVAHLVGEDAWQQLDAPARAPRPHGPLRRRRG